MLQAPGVAASNIPETDALRSSRHRQNIKKREPHRPASSSEVHHCDKWPSWLARHHAISPSKAPGAAIGPETASTVQAGGVKNKYFLKILHAANDAR